MEYLYSSGESDAIRQLRHDRQRLHRGKLRLHQMITDVQGVLGGALAGSAQTNAATNVVVTLNGLADLPTLTLDADRLLQILSGTVDYVARHVEPVERKLTLDFAYDNEASQLRVIARYRPHNAASAVDRALQSMLDGFDGWLDATPSDDLDENGVDDLPGPSDLAPLAHGALIACAMGGQLTYQGAADDKMAALVLTVTARVEEAFRYDDADEEADLDDPLIAVSQGKGLQPKMVLLIEDAAIASRIVNDYLQQMGHQVHIVERGGDAFDAVENIVFDLILLDLTLPDMSGWDVMARLQDLPDQEGLPPIYAFTANNQPDLLDRLKEAGFDGLLSKPVDWNQLRQLLTGVDDELQDPLYFQKVGYLDDWDACLDVALVEGSTQQELIEILGEEALAQLHADFLVALEEFGDQLGETTIGTDDPVWRQRCHNMKSMAGSLGAMRLSQMTHILTHYGWPSDAPSAAETLAATIQRTHENLAVCTTF